MTSKKYVITLLPIRIPKNETLLSNPLEIKEEISLISPFGQREMYHHISAHLVIESKIIYLPMTTRHATPSPFNPT